ncbi:ankyrin repeat-containing domain protein [Xylaria cf. heliscus]|nr:ankyrin repeat-containing domain protein [Xylaria cf. heliscus]
MFMPHLLRAGADVNAREDHQATALSYSVFGPDTGFFMPGYHPPREHRRAAELLLRRGADLNIQDAAGFTPLLHHIRDSAYLTVELFLQQHADHLLYTRDRRTVLHIAAEYADVQTLVALAAGRMHGLNIEQKDIKGSTALEVAENRRLGKLKPWTSPEERAAWLAAWGRLLEHVRRPLPVATSAFYAPELAELSNESDESWHTAVEEFALDIQSKMALPTWSLGKGLA